MKVSTIFRAYELALGRHLTNLAFQKAHGFPPIAYPAEKVFRQISTFEMALDKRIPQLEKKAWRDSEWVHIDVFERKANLQTRRENRHHLHRIRVLEAQVKDITHQYTTLIAAYQKVIQEFAEMKIAQAQPKPPSSQRLYAILHLSPLPEVDKTKLSDFKDMDELNKALGGEDA